MHADWQWCTHVGSLPSAVRSAHRSHWDVNTGRLLYSYLPLAIMVGPSSNSTMPFASPAFQPCSTLQAMTQERQAVHQV